MRNFEPTKKPKRHTKFFEENYAYDGKRRKKTQSRGGKKKYFEDWK